MTSPDPTLRSQLRPLFQLLEALDDDIARVYAARGVEGVRPRFTAVLIRLAHTGPMTIRELAEAMERTHSALSQTVTALRKEGLVTSVPGTDARTRQITLTPQGRALVPFLEAEWRATEAAVAELESEVPYPLTKVVQDLTAALADRSFADRIAAHLDREAGPARPGVPQ